MNFENEQISSSHLNNLNYSKIGNGNDHHEEEQVNLLGANNNGASAGEEEHKNNVEALDKEVLIATNKSEIVEAPPINNTT